MMNIFSETIQRLTDYFLVTEDVPGYFPVIDISRYQAPVDFEMMYAAGVRLVILRLSVGNYYTDLEFINFYNSAKAQGLKVGCYHVVKPSLSITSQWARIMDSLDGRELDMPLVLDCELTDNQNPTTIAGNIEGLVNKHLTTLGTYPVIYTRALWWNSNTIYKPPFHLCPLWIARYSETIPHPWADDPDHLRPRDWNTYALWQYSADGNGLGAVYGVGSDDVDINRSSAETLAGTLALLNGTPPPPDPIGETEMMYTADVIYLTPGTTYRNIRSKPDSTGSDAGLDVGDVVITDKGLPVYEVQTTPEGDWYHLKKNTTVGWVLGKVGNTVYLKLTPVLPLKTVTAGVEAVKLHYWKTLNAQGKPIMEKPAAPSKFALGAAFAVDLTIMDADGTEDYYHVLTPLLANPPAPNPPAPYTGWYVKVAEVI